MFAVVARSPPVKRRSKKIRSGEKVLMWLRRRFSLHESSPGVALDETTVCLRSFRVRPERLSHNGTKTGMERSSDSPIECLSAASSRSSIACSSRDSEATIKGGGTADSDDEASIAFDPPPNLYTPVMRRRRPMNQPRRNYRILDPDESLMIIQQQSAKLTPKSKISRRKSTKKELDFFLPSNPMVITPPTPAQPMRILNRSQSCAICRPEASVSANETDPGIVMSPTSLSTPRIPDEESAARLSLISSSTGYSSARSSLRSSDGTEDGNPRDSTLSTGSISLSSARQEVLVRNGAISHLDRIAIELVETERAYVKDLQDVIRGYMNFMVDEREELGVTLEDITSLFGCIERIFLFNTKLYQKLDQAELDCVRMCMCFVENAGKFEDYIAYCMNYQRMLGTLNLLQQQPELAKVLTERQKYLGHTLGLAAYLLKPVQRILKYHLFIENMLKNLPSSTNHDELAIVKRAYEVMTSQATRINEEKKKAEHAERVIQLQAALHKWKVDKTANLSSYGDLLLEAQFRQAGTKTTRTLFLFEEMLLIVKRRNNTYTCKDYIMTSNLMLIELVSNEEPLAFQVLPFDNPRNYYVFLANTADQKRVWMTELKRMLLDHYAVEIPEKTKMLMLSMDNTQKVAFGRPEFAEVSTKNHKKVPKYLEKRRKSMDQDSRRRSLSASRLLATSKSSLLPDTKVPIVLDSAPKCTCHLVQENNDKDTRGPVIRTWSASTIDVHGVNFQPKTSSEVQSSRSRFYQARNRRHLPPKDEVSRSASSRRLNSDDIAATFDELYNELVSVGNGNDPQSDLLATRRLEALVLRSDPSIMNAASRGLRSKSLTRLNDSTFSAKPLLERRYSKLEDVKREWTKKFNGDETGAMNNNEAIANLMAAKLASITVDESEELPSAGMVKSRIRQLENRCE